MLRRASRLLFLGFYVASTIAIAEVRTSSLVDQLMHDAGSGGGKEFNQDSRQISDGYPRHREAKKVSFAFELRSLAAAAFDLRITAREFAPAPTRVISSLVVSATPSRSPPSLS